MEVVLTCEVEEELSTKDLSEFLADLTFLYDRCVMLKDDPHQPILYSPDFYKRWRRLPRGVELKIRKISKDSPLEIVLIVTPTLFILQPVKMFLEILRLLLKMRKEMEIMDIEKKIKEVEYLDMLLKLSKEFNIPLEQIPFIKQEINKLSNNTIKIVDILIKDEKNQKHRN